MKITRIFSDPWQNVTVSRVEITRSIVQFDLESVGWWDSVIESRESPEIQGIMTALRLGAHDLSEAVGHSLRVLRDSRTWLGFAPLRKYPERGNSMRLFGGSKHGLDTPQDVLVGSELRISTPCQSSVLTNSSFVETYHRSCNQRTLYLSDVSLVQT